jgi:hypothetical protein
MKTLLFVASLVTLTGCGPSAFEQRTAQLQQDCDYGSASACIGLQDQYATRRAIVQGIFSQPAPTFVPAPITLPAHTATY